MDKEALFKSRITEDEMEIPGVGTVRFRALTRAEAMTLRSNSMALDDVERQMLSWSLLDPQLTTGEVRLWQEASTAGEIEPLCEAIANLSGMKQNAAKEAVRKFRS